MQDWLPDFVIVASVALVLQTVVILAAGLFFFVQARRMQEAMKEPRAKVNALLGHIEMIVSDAQPQLKRIVSDAADVTNLAKEQARRANVVATEAVDRMRLQVVHTDRILTKALDSLEDAGGQLRRGVLWPVKTVLAFKQGLETGFRVYHRRQGNHHDVETSVDMRTFDL